MIVTVFRSRVKPEVQQDYVQWANRMSRKRDAHNFLWSVVPSFVGDSPPYCELDFQR